MVGGALDTYIILDIDSLIDYITIVIFKLNRIKLTNLLNNYIDISYSIYDIHIHILYVYIYKLYIINTLPIHSIYNMQYIYGYNILYIYNYYIYI